MGLLLLISSCLFGDFETQEYDTCRYQKSSLTHLRTIEKSVFNSWQ